MRWPVYVVRIAHLLCENVRFFGFPMEFRVARHERVMWIVQNVHVITGQPTALPTEILKIVYLKSESITRTNLCSPRIESI